MNAPMHKITPAMRREFDTLLAEKGLTRFRRLELAARLYPITRPRSQPLANTLADTIMKDAARAGLIERTGHQHWIRSQSRRTLKSGRCVPDTPVPVEITMSTRCPAKWVSVDLETGDIWVPEKSTWKRASPAVAAELRALLK
jgi:hypothetical protein